VLLLVLLLLLLVVLVDAPLDDVAEPEEELVDSEEALAAAGTSDLVLSLLSPEPVTTELLDVLPLSVR
jgi:hypothetical protein